MQNILVITWAIGICLIYRKVIKEPQVNDLSSKQVNEYHEDGFSSISTQTGTIKLAMADTQDRWFWFPPGARGSPVSNTRSHDPCIL